MSHGGAFNEKDADRAPVDDELETADPGYVPASSALFGTARFDRILNERAAAAQQMGRSLKAWRKASSSSTRPSQIPEAPGQALSSDVRKQMEPRLGAPLGDVRVHTGGESAQAASSFGARAFTVGRDVHFNSGQYAPGTKEGDRLLAHELTHVVQGQRSPIHRDPEEGAEEAGGPEVSQPEEPAEQEADAKGDEIADDLHGGEGGGGKQKGGQHAEAAPPEEAAPEEPAAAKLFRKVFRQKEGGEEVEAEGAEEGAEEGPEADKQGNKKEGDGGKHAQEEANAPEGEAGEAAPEEAAAEAPAAEAEAPQEAPPDEGVAAKLFRKVFRKKTGVNAPGKNIARAQELQAKIQANGSAARSKLEVISTAVSGAAPIIAGLATFFVTGDVHHALELFGMASLGTAALNFFGWSKAKEKVIEEKKESIADIAALKSHPEIIKQLYDSVKSGKIPVEKLGEAIEHAIEALPKAEQKKMAKRAKKASEKAGRKGKGKHGAEETAETVAKGAEGGEVAIEVLEKLTEAVHALGPLAPVLKGASVAAEVFVASEAVKESAHDAKELAKIEKENAGKGL
jgi:hypothetical protein